MKQNIYFKNSDDLKKKVLELIENCTDFTVTGDCITFEQKDNIVIEYKCKSGTIRKTLYVEGENIFKIINNIYATIDLYNVFGENGCVVGVKIIK